MKKLFTYLCNVFSASLLFSAEGEDCEIQFAESVLLPAAQAYRQDRPDYDPNYDDPDDILQFYIALDVSGNLVHAYTSRTIILNLMDVLSFSL